MSAEKTARVLPSAVANGEGIARVDAKLESLREQRADLTAIREGIAVERVACCPTCGTMLSAAARGASLELIDSLIVSVDTDARYFAQRRAQLAAEQGSQSPLCNEDDEHQDDDLPF